jgi:glycosyltransferase involved in cell wall biosynthesis
MSISSVTSSKDLSRSGSNESPLAALRSPSATIVICNYNYGRFLAAAMLSALEQTVPCQVIVVDDGSTDQSRALLSKADPRIEVVLQANAGQVAAYNAGFARATGEIVLFLDADDLLEPTAVELASQRFGHGVAKVHFRLAMMDEQGTLTGRHLPSALGQGDVTTALVRHGLLYASPPGSGNVYRRSVLEQLFPLPVDAFDKIGADFFTIYGCVAFGQVAACGQCLARYRVHRRSADASQQVVFGNAALGNDEASKVESRYHRLVGWLEKRTGGKVRYADRFLDFSILKSPFAMNVLAESYPRAIAHSGPALSRLLKALWLQPDYSVAKKLGLSAWTFLVLLAPRGVARPAARFVCNPASRGA